MNSYWEEERKNHDLFEEIKEDKKVSVCIIGGGLTGLQTAYNLSDKLDVVILEKDRICGSTSGKTTGKITSQHGVFYDYLINSQSKEFAKMYLEANEKAIQNIKDIVEKEEIECDLEEESSYVFTKQETKLDMIKNEQKAVDKLQKEKSDYVKEIELPTEISGAIEFKNQAQFHPLKYAYGLAKAIIKMMEKYMKIQKLQI